MVIGWFSEGVPRRYKVKVTGGNVYPNHTGPKPKLTFHRISHICRGGIWLTCLQLYVFSFVCFVFIFLGFFLPWNTIFIHICFVRSVTHYYPEFLGTITNSNTANCIFLGNYHLRFLKKDDDYEYFCYVKDKKPINPIFLRISSNSSPPSYNSYQTNT